MLGRLSRPRAPLSCRGGSSGRLVGEDADAILGGPEAAVDRAEGDDPDRTCREALQAVTTATLDSVAELSPVETETALSPASASVRRGDEVEPAVGAGGVDLFIESEAGGYSFLGGLAVGADPAPITAAPLTGRDNVDVVTTSADTTSTAVNSIGEFPPATYDVSEATPGLDELVTETTTLTVEPAN